MDYDPQKTNYTTLLKVFWKNHDPTVYHCSQYMSVIFYHNEKQRTLAESTLQEQQKVKCKTITTKILPARPFYEAEGYHQKYILQRHPVLLTKLGISPEDLIDSHVCARLNGYIAGCGSLAAFEKECEDLGLHQTQADYVRRVLGGSRVSTNS